MARKRQRGRGFTLIEAVVAMFLIGLAISFAFQVFPRARESSQGHQDHVRAALLGEGLLQRARAVAFDELASYSGEESYQGLADGHPFSRTMRYQVQVTLAGTDRKRVAAEVTWTDGGGRSRRFVAETVVADLGVAP